ncbi:MAG TPA: carboxypeptidase regulatory-like domain-containing protein [Candidatus Acidoferrum sp.]|nr:carboxypeptidase regulatory-like domain-containing protein [Candidatus Acidoferrum sp.]
MKKLLYGCFIVALVMLIAGAAAAQADRLDGKVLDKDGNPYPDVTVKILNTATGQSYTTKTDKDGNFVQLGMGPGLYEVTFTNEKDNFTFVTRVQISSEQENPLNISVKDLLAKNLIANPDAEKKRAEEENKFKALKEHFQNGLNAMNEAEPLREQLKTAPADQKSAIQDKLNADYATAINEFQIAEQSAGPKETKNHALVLAHLGEAYEYSGKYDDAAATFQKAIDLQPQAAFYTHVSTNLANSAVLQTDPKVRDQKLADAASNCDKAVALDPTLASMCWKNIGIVLSNKGLLEQAVTPLQKASQANPKDAQTWYLLGSALSATIQTQQEGDKLIYNIPPGTLDAYQNCIANSPNSPLAAQCQAALDGLKQLSGGEDLTIKTKKHK